MLIIFSIVCVYTTQIVTAAQPKLCEAWDLSALPVLNKTLTMKDIVQLRDDLGENIVNLNNENNDPSYVSCYKVIKTRIYGSMQLSNELFLGPNGGHAPTWLKKFKNIEKNENKRADYAEKVKNAFYESFLDCDKGSCIVGKFCYNLVRIFDGTDALFDQLEERCLTEGWRFQGFINDGSTKYCEFSIVPMSFEGCG